jgi:arylsulfatase A-like enzyme
LTVIIAGAGAVVVLAGVESLHLPVQVVAAEPKLVPAVLKVSLEYTVALLVFPLAYALLVGASLGATGRLPARFRLAAGAVVQLTASSVVTHLVYRQVTTYRPFASYPPLVGSLTLLAVVLAAGYLSLQTAPRGRGWRAGVVAWGAAAVGALGFLATHAVNVAVFRGLYPTLHAGLLSAAFLLLHLGLCGVLVRVRWWRWRASRLAGAASVAFGAVLAIVALPGDEALATARPLVSSFSVVGVARAGAHAYDPEQEERRVAPLPPDDDAEARFRREAHLPELPGDFRLEEHNVLFVTVEAERFDQTSLSDPMLDTTPTLVNLERRGAFVAERAYSLSNGTLLAIAGMLAMSYPSHLRLQIWGKRWTGELQEEETTAPELFTAAGYDTFWISHNLAGFFGSSIRGFEQGLSTRTFVEPRDAADGASVDARIADAAIAAVEARASRRFFGWVFFGGPHAPYLAHFTDRAAATELDRYRQEIRNVDDQLGRLLAALDANGLMEKTIVLFCGDHGEEFGEHGGSRHNTTVYSESLQVPLVIRLPGLAGRRLRRPISTGYLFPWLLLSGPEGMREAAARRVREHQGPMLRATGGAVVAETLGHDAMQVSLIYGDEKINHDFLTGRYELFAVERDRLEQTNLLFTAPERVAEVAARVEAYRRARATHRAFSIAPQVFVAKSGRSE